jgi:broad specificity phosphatase PhoE
MTVFHLVRHGQPAWELADERNLLGAARDWTPLNAEGCAQIERTADGLLDCGAQLILASPMTRAMQSAAILSRRLDLPLQVEFDLHEWLPDLSFHYTREIALARYDEMLRIGGEWPAGEKRGWEQLSSVRGRVMAVLKRYTHLDNAMVVCHGTVITSLTGRAVELASCVEYSLG